MKISPLPSIFLLREIFRLNRDTGELIWRTRPLDHFVTNKMGLIFNAQFAEKVAGYRDKRGYVGVSLGGKKYWAHRIVFALVHGHTPDQVEIDHVDGDPSNNRPANLRLATRSENTANGRRRRTNRLGFKGVFRSGNKFAAQITKDGETICLGSFDNPEDAHSAYLAAAKDLHGDFARAE